MTTEAIIKALSGCTTRPVGTQDSRPTTGARTRAAAGRATVGAVPEGDTVYLAGKRLHAALAGRRLVRGELRHPRLAEQNLAGRTVLGVKSVGKHLLTRFDDGRSLHSHFRMDGSWHLYRPGMAWRRPAHEIRAILAHDERVAVGYALHDLELLPTDAEDRVVGHLGPDLLDPAWDDAHSAEALTSADPSTSAAPRRPGCTPRSTGPRSPSARSTAAGPGAWPWTESWWPSASTRTSAASSAYAA